MPSPKIYLYAEALTNIRQLTLHASLQTDKNEHTKILLSSDKKIITALHDGESSSIYLPTQISGTAHVTFPIDKRTEISTRLQIDDVDQLKSSLDEPSGPEVPWTAVDLAEKVSVRCKECDACIVEPGKVVTWKDLPSENWAELMDFWFCHKPHHGHSPDHDHAAEAKGFSAKSKVTANPGVGLVDAVSFLLHRQDCSNIEVCLCDVLYQCFIVSLVFGEKKETLQFSLKKHPLIWFLIQSPYIKLRRVCPLDESTSVFSRWMTWPLGTDKPPGPAFAYSNCPTRRFMREIQLS